MNQNRNSDRERKSAISRRTLVRAAAAGVPVIALSGATPAFGACSTVRIVNASELQEAFTGPGFVVAEARSVSGGGVYELHGLKIDATLDGTTPAARGDLITVILPAGLAFAGGGSRKSYPASGATRSVDVPHDDIVVPKTTKSGNYTITVEFLCAQHTVTVQVVEGNLTYAWGDNFNYVVNDSATQTQRSPYQWGLTSGPTPYDSYTSVLYSTYASITGARRTLNAYHDQFDTIVTSGNGRPGASSPGRRRMAVGAAASLVTNNKGQYANATFFRGADGMLYATGDNAGDMFSLGDGTPYNGEGKTYETPVRVGTHILQANPGKSIVSVHTGSARFRAVYILSDGTVWNSGGNTNYAMGNGTWSLEQSLASQTLRAANTPLTDIVSAACGEQYTVYLDSSGHIWGAGTNDFTEGPLPGIPTAGNIFASPLALPEGKKVTKIWASGFDTIVQAADGACYIAGANSGGVGSTGNTARSRLTWTKINVPTGKTVADVAIAWGALYRMTDGSVYFAGGNGKSGNGQGPSNDNITTMTQVPLAGPAADIAVTFNGTYAALVPNRY